MTAGNMYFRTGYHYTKEAVRDGYVDIKYISVTFELQHNVCGRRVYAEGTVDAILFLAQVKAHKAKKRLYSMIDVLESGNLI